MDSPTSRLSSMNSMGSPKAAGSQGRYTFASEDGRILTKKENQIHLGQVGGSSGSTMAMRRGVNKQYLFDLIKLVW